MTIATEVSTPVEPTMDRDQRTVRVAVYTDRHHLPHRSPQCCIHCRRRQHSLYQRLGEVLTISACLLSLVRWPTAMAAPPHSHKRRSVDDLPPKWVNPCGFIPSSDEAGQSSSDVPDLPTTRQFLDILLTQAKIARGSVESFKKNYVKEIFDVDFDLHHKSWKTYRYEWLYPSSAVPKELGVSIHPDKLRDVQLDSFLKDAYRYMQIMSVAMEQVAFDHSHPEHGSIFAEQFKKMEYSLRAVLCEIQMTMIERRVEPHDDVTRDVMEDDIRDMEPDSRRDLRDWFIFRDCMIVLEYIIDVVQYFCDNPNRIPPS